MDRLTLEMLDAIDTALDVGQVVAAASPIADWMTAAETRQDLDLRHAAVMRQARNIRKACRSRDMAVPDMAPDVFLRSAQALYAAHRAAATRVPAALPDELSTP